MVDTTNILLTKKLNRYKIEDKIGAGGMARVYRAYDKTLDRPVAIKVLHEHLTEDSTFLERFAREAKFVGSFNHPNIVHIYDFNTIEYGEQSNLFYMVMSYLPGGTLEDKITDLRERETRLDQAQVLRIIQDIASALGYAHERGMIHRDIKPANILFDEQGRAVLTDFGIARMAAKSNLTQEGITVGTPAYMSPEQATGVNVGVQSDLYALGVILYELLTGNPPFTDDGGLSILLKHLNAEIPSLSRHDIVNPYLDAIIKKALAKEAEERYQTAQQFSEDLKLAFSGKEPHHAGEITANTTKAPNFVPNSYTKTVETVAQSERTDAEATSKTPITRQANRSPLGILAVGMLIITAILVVALLNKGNETSAENAGNNEASADTITINVDTPTYFTTNFNTDDPVVAYWPITAVNMVLRQLQAGGGYRIDNQRQGEAISTIFTGGSNYENPIIQLRGLLEDGSSPASAYGIIFHYQDENNYNVFAVDGMGRYSIWVRENGQWRELRGLEGETWTEGIAVYEQGTMNTLTVLVDGDEIIGSVNGMEVTTVTDGTFTGGDIGIYIASTPDDTATALFDMFEVVPDTSSMTFVESMTGDVPEEDSTRTESMTGDETEPLSPSARSGSP